MLRLLLWRSETNLSLCQRPGIHPCCRGQRKGAWCEKITIALLSLSISLCLGNAKSWQRASLPPTASSCARGFPIQAIYMVFWPLCDQAFANYLIPGGQNPGFSDQYWNQLEGKTPYCKVFFSFQTSLCLWPATLLCSVILAMHWYTHSATLHRLHWATRPVLVQRPGYPVSSPSPSPCSKPTCIGGQVASVSLSLQQEF